MKILCISDTHQKHNKLTIPECDVVIFSGDMCSSGDLWQVEHFSKWIRKNSNNFSKFLVVAGNHDLCLMNNGILAKEILKEHLDEKVAYLEDSEYIFNDIKFYGSPWQPQFHNWAFNLPRGERLQKVWANIPEDTNVLVTHGPPHGMGDMVGHVHVGCADLMDRLRNLPNLFLHVFGHIHSGNGLYLSEALPGVHFCNAAICDENYNPIQPAHMVDLVNCGKHHHLRVDRIDLNYFSEKS